MTFRPITVVCALIGLAAPCTGQVKAPRNTTVERFRLSPSQADLTDPGNAFLTSDGRLVVSQPKDTRVLIVDPNGPRVTVIGKGGEGPGEFRQIRTIGQRRTDLWVSDMQLRRISFISPTGTLLRTLPNPAAVASGGKPDPVASPLIPLAVYGDGSLLVRVGMLAAGQRPAWARDKVDEDVGLIVVDTVGAYRRTVAWLPLDICSKKVPIRQTVAFLPIPFCTRPVAAVSHDGAAIAIADLLQEKNGVVSFKVVAIKATGDTLYSRILSFPAVPVSPTALDSVKSVMAGRLPRAIPELKEIYRAMNAPGFQPPFSRLVWSRDGGLFVEITQARPGHLWLALDRAGNPAFTLELPAASALLAAGQDKVWTADADEDGLLGLSMHAIRRSSRP